MDPKLRKIMNVNLGKMNIAREKKPEWDDKYRVCNKCRELFEKENTKMYEYKPGGKKRRMCIWCYNKVTGGK